MLLDSFEEEIKEINADKFRGMLLTATEFLKKSEKKVNDLNVFPVPDGDTGTNMYLTLSNAVDKAVKIKTDSAGVIAENLANGALMSARGNSGVILSQLMRGLAEGISDSEVITSDILANGLNKASDKAYQAVMKPVEGTILTVARKAGEKAIAVAEDETDLVKLLAKVIEQAEKTVEKTPEMLDTLKKAGVVDAGGKGYAIILRGLLQGLIADDISDIDFETEDELVEKDIKVEHERSESEFGYCTEFIIKGAEVEESIFRNLISEYGDSLVVVKSGSIIKVHIHSNHPGDVLEKGLEYGQLMNIKIDNMSEQHEEVMRNKMEDKEKEEDKIAILAVVAGEGLENIFKGFGADYVIEGGQSMNPSTQDLLDGVEEINASKIIILPNNKNVISAAEQLQELTEKEVKVIKTTSVPQGVTAMMMYNPDGQLEDVFENMKAELDFVKTGEITYATRNTTIDDLEINKDDILGLVEGNIELVSRDYNEAVFDVLTKMVQEDDSLITVYAGQDVSDKKKKELKQDLKEKYKDFDIEVYDGKQPIYYYIISVE